MINKIQKIIEIICLSIILIFSIVLPNNLKELLLFALCVMCISYMYKYNNKIIKNNYFLYLIYSLPVTLIYLYIGFIRGVDWLNVIEIFFVYFISPLLWGIFISGVLIEYNKILIIKTILYFVIICSISQLIYFLIFIYLGPIYLEQFIDNPRVTFDGNLEIRMYMYGSLIFLISGFITSNEVIAMKSWRLIILAVGFISILASGRSILYLSVVIALSFRFIAIYYSKKKSLLINNTVIMIFLYLVIFLLCFEVFNFNIFVASKEFSEKISGFSQSSRLSQIYLLLDGIRSTKALGTGFGIPIVEVLGEVRSYRYELVGVALIYRVGILGALIYVLPFLITIKVGLAKIISRNFSFVDSFMLSGFIVVCVATNTNPYIEGFVFQWMYALPMIYFLGESKASIKLL